MSAQQKLNSVHLVGSFAVAAVIGTCAESWVVFIVTAGVLVAAGLRDGRIRPAGRLGQSHLNG